MRLLTTTAACSFILATATAPALATPAQTQGQGQGQIQGQIASSKATADAAAIGVNENRNNNRQQLSARQLNEQQLEANQRNAQSANTGDQSTSVDASSDDDTDIPVGSVISYTYVPNTIPQAVATDQVVVTSWTVHVLDPLFGMSDQHVHMVPSVAINLGKLALDTSTPEGTAAAAYVCTKDGDYAAALGVHCY
jgi:hypothetical protein